MISADNLTQDHLIAGVQWISKMADPARWNLKNDEIACLLGIEAATFEEIQHEALNCQPITLTKDTVERLSLLLEIWKALNLFVPHERQDLAFEWFSKPTTSPAFNHKSIKDFLIEGKTIGSFNAVINYLRNPQ